jgi:hypothetical protein
MRFLSTVAIIALTAGAAGAQTSESQPTIERVDRWRATLTIFRSPGTGLQLSKGHLAVFVAHYPTVIERGGEDRNTNFIRMGAAYYIAPASGTSPYASLSIAPSLTKGWSNSGIADVGVRQMLGGRISGQLGVAVLYAPSTKETRVNPTVGLGVRF